MSDFGFPLSTRSIRITDGRVPEPTGSQNASRSSLVVVSLGNAGAVPSPSDAISSMTLLISERAETVEDDGKSGKACKSSYLVLSRSRFSLCLRSLGDSDLSLVSSLVSLDPYRSGTSAQNKRFVVFLLLDLGCGGKPRMLSLRAFVERFRVSRLPVSRLGAAFLS